MTTYKSEQIEFRAGRIVLTEAQWTANTNVYAEGIVAITSDGSNAGKTKVFDGSHYWSQLSYTGSSSGSVTSDDVTDESTLDAGTVTGALNELAQNVSDQGTSITELTQDVAGFSGTKRYKVILTQTGTDAPAITVQRNSLGGVPVSSYVDVGQYRITLSGAFPVAKTTAILQNNSDDGAAGLVYSAKVHSSGNYVSIATGSGEDYLDDILNNTCLLIEVEP